MLRKQTDGAKEDPDARGMVIEGRRPRTRAKGAADRQSPQLAPPASAKRQPPLAAPKPNLPGNIALIRHDDETRGQALARLAASPEFNAGVTVHEFVAAPLRELDPGALLTQLEAQTRAVQSGDLSDMEAMLASQAQTLSAIFFSVMLRAKASMGECPAAAETYMRLALKAQAQCRATVETLSEMKNPKPATFVRQANIANGHQQVNNGEASQGRAEVFDCEQNELQPTTGRSLAAGASAASRRADQGTATVVEIDRAKDRRRKG